MREGENTMTELHIIAQLLQQHDLAIHSFLVDNEFATLKAQDLVQKTFEGEDDSSITVVLGLLCVPGEDAVAFVNESGIFGVLSFSSESERCALYSL